MKFLTKKGLINKIVLALLILMLFNALIPTNISFGKSDETFGGKLLKPVVDLLLALGDVVVDIIHNALFGINKALIRIDMDNGILEFLGTIIIGVVAAVIIAIAGGLIVGVAAKIIAAIAAKITVPLVTTGITTAAIGTIIAVSLKGGIYAGALAHSSFFGNEVVLPIYQISPEEIFSGKIDALNVNFFSNEDSKQETIATYDNELIYSSKTMRYGNDTVTNIKNELANYGYSGDVGLENILADKTIATWESNNISYEAKTVTNTRFEGSTPIIDIQLNIYKTTKTETIVENNSIAKQLKPTIAKWYYTLRNAAIVVMMLVLLYVGIKILMCSTAPEKAKYKNMLVDWVVALCLIFVMHYIMAFVMNISDSFIKLVSTIGEENKQLIEDEDGKISKELKSDEMVALGINADDVIIEKGYYDADSNYTYPENYIQWDAKNIMGLVRIQAALKESGSYIYIGYVLCFLVLVFFTMFFLFTYIKRVIYLAFLTLIAPLVAMTYPIDKINDGKAQAFNMWLKEYIFNLIIQPAHLLLYTVLISSAYELANENVLYTLIAIGFLMPAEKLLRKMFGFDKAQTPGLLGGAAGAAILMNGLNHVFRRKPPQRGKDMISSKGNQGNAEEQNIDSEGIDMMNLVEGTVQPPTVPPDGTWQPPAIIQNQNTEDEGNIIDLPIENYSDSDGTWQPQAIIQNQNTDADLDNPPVIPLEINKQEKTNDSTNLPQKLSRFASMRSGLKLAGQEYARQKLTRAYNNVITGQPLRKMSNMATGVLAGAGTAMLGAAIGIASGDPSKTAQYATAGAAGGYAIGARDRKPNIDEEEIRKEYLKGKHGSIEEYKKAQLAERSKKYIQDSKNVKDFQEKLNIENMQKAQEKLKEYSFCIDKGITDINDIATVAKLMEEKQWSQQKAVSAAIYYKKAGKQPRKMGKKDRENIEYIYSNALKKNGITDKVQLEDGVLKMCRTVDEFGDVREKLTFVK